MSHNVGTEPKTDIVRHAKSRAIEPSLSKGKKPVPLERAPTRGTEFPLGQFGLFENLLQQPAFYVATMHRHRLASPANRMFQSQVTTALIEFDKTRPLERADNLEGIRLREPRQASRGVPTDIGIAYPFRVRFSTGNGSPSRTRLDKWHSMA